MGDLLGFIAPILAIVFWLVGISKSGEENKKQQQQQQTQRTSSQPATTQTYETRTQRAEYAQPNLEQDSTDFLNPSMTDTFEQQKEKQMEDLQQKIERAQEIRKDTKKQPKGQHNAIKDKPTQRAYRKHDEDTSLSVTKNLTTKGVAQGIIMAEVLGPPRAYQKRAHNRNYR